ncbi:MAG TPA: GYF domain-containing protein, partial [Myxococcales bacterium]|nr:GYF domain-containing protein [Myxococcales bacterium]
MQFACENCKTQLQIADEKVRGKRLIVPCKRCGAKIAIADPALGGAPGPRLVAAGFPARAAPRPAQPQPAASRPAPVSHPHAARDTDIESTRAMESDVLEKALRASKQDSPAQPAGPRGASAPPDPFEGGEALQAPAAPADEALWFAMLHGTQTGPLTRSELTGRANAGEVGPRTYLWREGMDAWQRAKDVSELAFLFPQPAFSAPRPSAPPVAAPESSAPPVLHEPEALSAPAAANEAQEPVQPLAAEVGEGGRVQGEEVARDLFTPAESQAAHKTPADLARWASDELARKRDTSPRQAKVAAPSRMFEGAAPPRSRGPFSVFMILMALAVAAAVLWGVLAPGKEKAAEAPDAGQTQAEPAADAGKAAAAEPTPRPAEPPAPAPTSAPPAPGPTPGLTADQVRKKLDEHKPALQGCVDEALRRDPHLRLGRIHIATTI